ncbi:hypothetical protein CCB80_01480 [Armatimonadetes bacterium Uphvl-Ar1]|nr:hypothetical protein CCB80_01480 [Armatimonadetes bacterium Uphvl-Ar1]
MVATLSKNTAGTSWSLGNERSYDVWGSVRSGAATGGPKGRYVANLGHVQDDESGLIYMRARYYEPETGRFVSEDRVMDGSNWYVYCKNAPTLFVDESGNSPTVYINMILFTAGFIIGHIVGVTIAVLLLMRNNPDYVVQNTVVRNLFFIGLEILTFLSALTIPGAKGEFGFADKSLKEITKTIVNSVRQTGWGRHGLAAGLGFMFGVMFGVLNAMYDAFLWEMENE